MESQIQVAQDTRGERVKHVSGWYFVGSQFFYLCEKSRTQVRSRQICHEDVKFYTIANGMCVGQCEGSTLYEVAVDEPCADRAYQTFQSPPEYDGTVVGLHKNKKDLDLECKSATTAV